MNDALVHEIVARFHAGMSVRRIAQSLRVGRRTVRQASRANRASSLHRNAARTVPANPRGQPTRPLSNRDR